MSRFTDQNHEYNDICLDEIGISIMKDKLKQIVNTNKDMLINILDSYNPNISYRVFEISDNCMMVINKSDNPILYFCVGYPFPIYLEETYVDFLDRFSKKYKIEIKIFIRGKELRIEQKNYMERFLFSKFEKVQWNNINNIDVFSSICDEKIRKKIDYNRFYFDPYAFIGDSILGLSFIDFFNQKYGERDFVVFSKAQKHVKCFFEAYEYKTQEINEKLTNYNIILMPDLIDNHLGKTLNTLSLLTPNTLVLILGRNILIEITGKSCTITNLVADDVLLLNQNINDYMFDCISPFFANKEKKFMNFDNCIHTRHKNGIFINPFSSTTDKDLTVEFVIELIDKIRQHNEHSIYISAGDGSQRINEWLEKFRIYKDKKDFKNIEILLDKGLADLGNKLIEKVDACITTDTAVSHLITRLGLLNITIYKEGFWDINSLQSLSAESPIGFCSYNNNQFIAILNNDNFSEIINGCAETIYFINNDNVFSQIPNDMIDFVNEIDNYIDNGNESELEKIIYQYRVLENKYSQINWIFNLYNPVYFSYAIKKIDSIYCLTNILKSVWEISNMYKYIKWKRGNGCEY